MYDKIVNFHDYIRYLEHLNIDTEELKEKIDIQIDEKRNIFETFGNRMYGISSPNINLENIIFEEANKYIFHNDLDEFQFDVSFKLDIESLIAVKFSLIERPNIKRPSDIKEDIKEELERVGSYIRIAKFENEIIFGKYDKYNSQNIIFEGLTPLLHKRPFFEYIPSSLIWQNKFYFPSEERIIGFFKKFNTIESKYVLWLDSRVLVALGLKMDDCNNGLRAINDNGEVILEFRHWKDDLIGNGASFVGQDSNIATLEGCDLILREDYVDLLQQMIPELDFCIHKIIEKNKGI